MTKQHEQAAAAMHALDDYCTALDALRVVSIHTFDALNGSDKSVREAASAGLDLDDQDPVTNSILYELQKIQSLIDASICQLSFASEALHDMLPADHPDKISVVSSTGWKVEWNLH